MTKARAMNVVIVYSFSICKILTTIINTTKKNEIMSDSYKYRGKNFGIKAPRHLNDFIIFTEGKIIKKKLSNIKIC